MLSVLHFSLFTTMSQTNYKSGNFQRDNTTVKRIGHFQSWSHRKKLASVKVETWLRPSRKEFWGKSAHSCCQISLNGIFEGKSEKVMVDSRIGVERRPSAAAHHHRATIGRFVFVPVWGLPICSMTQFLSFFSFTAAFFICKSKMTSKSLCFSSFFN